MKAPLLFSLAVLVMCAAYSSPGPISLPSVTFAQDDEDEEKKSGPVTPAEYVEAIATFETKELDNEGFRASVTVVPDLYLYQMALEYELLTRSGYNELEIHDKMNSRHREVVREKGRMLFKVEVELEKNAKHYFLERALKKHLRITQERDASFTVDDVSPPPVYASWKIMELSRHKSFDKKLWRLEDFEFRVTVKSKAKDLKAPIEFELRGLRCYKEVEKRSEYERIGINVVARQLALTSWKETELEDMTFQFTPGRWNLPEPPEGLAGILERLELD